MPAANETRTRRPFGGVRPSEGRCVSAIRRRSGRRTTGIVCPPSLARIDFCPLENQGVSDEKVSGTFSQALIDELEFNAKVAANADSTDQGCTFHAQQFLRAIHEGSIAILREEIRDAVTQAYVAMGAANRLIETAWTHPKGSNPWANGVNEARDRIVAARPKIESAKSELLKFLATEATAA